jgi:hypothetical protein
MGAIIGFAIGYAIGTRDGQAGPDELREAWATIRTSQELRDLIVGGLAVARDMARHGRSILAERLAVDDGASLRPVA